MTKHPMLYAWVISLALAPLGLLSDATRGQGDDVATASSAESARLSWLGFSSPRR